MNRAYARQKSGFIATSCAICPKGGSVAERNAKGMKQFKIIGNHPIAKYITWTATGLQELDRKVRELEQAGYEVTVESGDTSRKIKPKKKADYRKYKIRVCHTLHYCNVCKRNIYAGQSYHDGGYGRRCHTGCVDGQEEIS